MIATATTLIAVKLEVQARRSLKLAVYRGHTLLLSLVDAASELVIGVRRRGRGNVFNPQIIQEILLPDLLYLRYGKLAFYLEELLVKLERLLQLIRVLTTAANLAQIHLKLI